MHIAEVKRYDYIDALRGFAILGVVLVHSSQWVTPTSSVLSALAGEGARGVQLFYIASALTLFLSMAARSRSEERPVLGFFVRRFFRIAPAFYCAIVVYTLYYGMGARYTAPNGIEWWYVLLTALFVNGWHPETINSVVPGGWSIAVEMTFYLLVPLFFLKLQSLKSTLVALVASLALSIAASLAVQCILAPAYPQSQQYLVTDFALLWFFSQLPIFVAGILLYHIITRYPSAVRPTSIGLLCASLLMFGALVAISTLGNWLPKQFFYGLAFTVFSLSLYYWPNGVLVNGLTTLIGRLSFSIYLVHFMVLQMMRAIFPNGFIVNGDIGFMVAFLLVLLVSTCISYATHRAIELPGIALGKRIVERL